MIRSKNFDDNDCAHLKALFNSTLSTAVEIFDGNVFKIYENDTFSGKPKKGIYDAVMVPLSEFEDRFEDLIYNKEKVIELTKQLFKVEGVSALTGRASTKKDLEGRIEHFRQLFNKSLSN